MWLQIWAAETARSNAEIIFSFRFRFTSTRDRLWVSNVTETMSAKSAFSVYEFRNFRIGDAGVGPLAFGRHSSRYHTKARNWPVPS
jgi:hypothetical protein